MIKVFKIAVIAGDGIGPEVITEGIKVLKKISELDGTIEFTFDYFPWGCEYYLENGKMMPSDALKTLKNFDAIYLGAVGYPGVPDHISLWDLLLTIRKGFDQYVNIRPIKLLKGAPCPLINGNPTNIDMIFFRENVEGEYAGQGNWLNKGRSDETVIQNAVFSKIGTERIIRYAFEESRRLNKTLTSVSKANALNYSMVYWDEIFKKISEDYPDVKTYSYLVDAAAMFMVKQPERFEVVVTSNLFGDILTDLGAGIAGGLGLAAGANINPERKFPSMFEPIHGSAPDIAGKNIANPLAAIWSVSQMLDFFGMEDWGKLVLEAIEVLLTEKTLLTPDLFGNSTTQEVGDGILKKLEELKRSQSRMKVKN